MRAVLGFKKEIPVNCPMEFAQKHFTNVENFLDQNSFQ